MATPTALLRPEDDLTVGAAVIASMHAMPSSRWLGLQVLGLSAFGHSVIELKLGPHHSFDGTTAQRGLVGMLADHAATSACTRCLPPG